MSSGYSVPVRGTVLIFGERIPESLQIALQESKISWVIATDSSDAAMMVHSGRANLVVCQTGVHSEQFFKLITDESGEYSLPVIQLRSEQGLEVKILAGGRVRDWVRGWTIGAVVAEVVELLYQRKLAATSGYGWSHSTGGSSELEMNLEQMVHLMVYLLDLSVPGAAIRCRELADMALRLAGRFEVPDEFLDDLERAALLYEIGRVLDPHGDRSIPADARVHEPGPADYLAASAAILKQVKRFRGVSELVECISENWDGSGIPGHRERGQIPFRSRLLRVLIDYSILRRGDRGSGLSVAASLEELSKHSGTWYDPLVVGRFMEIARDSSGAVVDGTRRHLSVNELEPGMELAEDLCTGSGVKLLNQGAVLTVGYLDIIIQRHQADPVLRGAWVVKVDQS